MRVITASDINRALHNTDLVERLRTGFRSDNVRTSRDSIHCPSPTGQENAVSNTTTWTEGRFIGVRINSFFPENINNGKSADMGLYVLMSGRTGDALAMIDGPALFGWSRAATMGLAASYFARPDCERLLLMGVSPDVPPILQTFEKIRPIANVLIWDPDNTKAVKAAAALDKPERRVAATDDLEAALHGAHIICHANRSITSDLKSAWLPSGAHLSVQCPTPEKSPITLDSWANVRAAIDHTPADTTEIEVLLKGTPANLFQVSRGEHPGRNSYGERTAFLQTGTGLEDLIMAITVLEIA